MFSNGILVATSPTSTARGPGEGALGGARSRWHAGKQGRAVFRAECASCHTLDGYLSIRARVAPVDADMLDGILATMRAEGDEYVSGKYTHQGHVDTAKLDYPFMPPLVGTDAEIEALTAYLVSLKPRKQRR